MDPKVTLQLSKDQALALGRLLHHEIPYYKDAQKDGEEVPDTPLLEAIAAQLEQAYEVVKTMHKNWQALWSPRRTEERTSE
jgi:hypothetical protein